MAELLLDRRSAPRRRAGRSLVHPDWALLAVVGTLLGLGLVMVASASITVADRNTGNPLYFFQRQLVFVAAGLMLMALMYRIPLQQWERSGRGLLLFVAFLLVLVLIPGVGKTVNGSTRWLPLGFFSLQVSEFAKLFVAIYLAGFLVRRGEQVRNDLRVFLRVVAVLGVFAVLLLLEPDFGAAVVLMGMGMGMLFLAGVRLGRFAGLMGLLVLAMGVLAVSSPYRLKRLTAFLDPWQDPFNSGFQLTQALIAIGRGGWTGAGLGNSIQKLFYLPEAHNDFLFAVFAEEFGLLGVLLVIGLYGWLLWRIFAIGGAAERLGQCFGAFLAWGAGIWIGLQAFINIGVNMGMLPTKGLTLPLMSAGGSSMLVTCTLIGLVLRIDRERREAEASAAAPRQRVVP